MVCWSLVCVGHRRAGAADREPESKGLSRGQHILDYMGSTELAANLFRITQTDEQLRLHEVGEKDEANRTHF
jgi:DNA-damage-inducible protein D